MSAITSEFLSVDPYLKNAFSSAVKFDISHKSGHSNGMREGRQKGGGEGEEISVYKSPSKQWEVDVRPQMSTKKWLQSYGLRKCRLQMNQILEIIGFKLSDDFDPSLKRPVSSRYSQGLFEQTTGNDGKTFNLACDRDKLLQLKKRLMQTIALYRRRLEWLTSESRRIFGVVEEKAVTVVLDIRNMSPEQFDQYRCALERVMREQFLHLTKFNLIRAAEDVQQYSPECFPLSVGTVEAAIQWLWNLDRLAPVSNTACAEAVLKALLDRHNEAIYLFTEGTSIDYGRELVLEKLTHVERKIPVHVVSFNCNSSDTVKFLRNFTTVTGGRFHAYAVATETDAFDPAPPTADPFVNKSNVLLKRKTFGSVPSGAGVRPDVVMLFEELEEARNNLQQLEILIDRTPEPNRTLTDKVKREKTEAEEKDEQYMSSKQWLSVYGIDAKKLNLQQVLSSVAFKHQDGVVEVLEKPTNDQTDAVGQEKLINARYCEKFPVVRWKDDRVVHVQVTPEVHRTYEQRMHVTLNAIQQRIDWLKQGSRALFGTVVEEEICVLIDTSASMQHSIQFVKERLLVLMQEQLRHKSKFNLIAFNSKVVGWRDHLMEVNEKSLQSAWKWTQGLTCWGSTNTYAALQTALADTNTQAIYLLTDGRPDQPAKSILTQVKMQNGVPIHTISFNCDDNDANQFLFDLAKATGGRYHCFTEPGKAVEQPEAWQSEDIKLLEDEMGRGLEYLDRMAELRDQCAAMAWKTDVDSLKTCSKGHSVPDCPGRISAVPPLDARDLFRPPSPSGPSSVPPHPYPPTRPARPSSAVTFRPSRPHGLPKRPQSAKAHQGRKLVAGRSDCGPAHPQWRGHTRTSLMRTLNSSGRFTPSEWLLPETARLFEQQSDRQRQLAELLFALGLAPSVKATEERVRDQENKQKKRRHRLANAHASSSKQWLKRHGLVAKRLTILDALAPTLVPHRSTYIPVLDKRVMSRVFDEILPFAHVSGKQKNKVTLVNPNAVNLTEYEESLEKALARYRRRLNTIVWSALPESVKEEFESEEPASFLENRAKFLKALEEEDWPVTESDIVALEREIARGEKFLQQSKDLRCAVTEGASDAASDVSGPHSVKESAKDEEDEAVSESVDQVLQVQDDEILTAPSTPRAGSNTHTPRPPDSPSPRSQDARTLRSQDAHALHSPEVASPRSQSMHTPRPPDNPTPRSSHGNTPRKSSTKAKPKMAATVRSPQNAEGRRPPGKDRTANRVNSKKDGGGGEKAASTRGKGRVMVSMLRGTRVIARNHVDGLYYPGKVVKCPNVRHATVEFTNGQQDVLTRFILPTGGAVACPPLSVGDYGLVQVMNLDQETECYVPSIVQFTPQRRQAQAQFYTVMLYNGQKVTTRRSHLVKISKERFELSARYITEVLGEDRKEVENKVYVSQKRKTEDDKIRRESRHRHRSPSVSSQESRSRSRSLSRSPSPGTGPGGTRSRSRSSSPSSRPRSPTPGVGLRESLSLSRSRSHPSSSRRRQEMKIVGKHNEDRYKNSRRGIETRSRSRSESNSPSRQDSVQQKSRSRYHSRSRSRSPSSPSGRKSKKEVRNKRSRSRSGSRSALPISGDGLESVEVQRKSYSERKSRSSSRSSRSATPVTDRQRELKRLKKQLKEQQRQQAREQKRLKWKVKKLSKVQTQLLERILDEKKEDNQEQEAEKEEEPEEEEAPIVTPRMLHLRRTMPEMQPAEEVLARFSDDGWYYRATVQQNLGDLSYIVEDAAGYIERIWREDIISDYDDSAPPLKEDDRVIAQHPHYSSSYAPGSVLSFDDIRQAVTVLFYDGQEGKVPRVEVYCLPREKYNHDVLHIQQRQRSMLGLSVVARDDNSGEYFPGQITDVKEGEQSYVIRWSDGSKSEQLPVHIFSAMTRRPRLLIGDRVLAVANPEVVVFLPGQIIGAQDGGLVVHFCDGQVRDDVSPLFCYWLTPRYFEEASYFWKMFQPDLGKRQVYQA